MASSTVEDYLKHLYLLLQQQPDALVPLGRLASALNVTPGTVTTMIKALDNAGLVRYEPRTGAALTPGGEQLALHVLRRHRLVELLLVQVLGLDWSEVHSEAEELEHAISDKVLDRIDALLGYPGVDPHGDPIPTASGQIANPDLHRLGQCRPGQRYRVARIEDQEEQFLRFAAENGLTPGMRLIVRDVDPASHAVTIEVDSGAELTLSSPAANKILVR